MRMKMRMAICYNDNLYLNSIMKEEVWDINKTPHLAISGKTGTGKTVFCKIIMGQILKNRQKSNITICDFKGDTDYAFLEGYSRYYRFEDVKKGFDDFYNNFLDKQRTRDEKPTFLFFDEWASFLNFCDKKEAEAYKQKLANMLMLGRSLNVHIILSQQRLDAEYFAKSRDNFGGIIVLGNPSKEVVSMFFSDYKEEIIGDRMQGTGYMLVDGSRFVKIRVPYFKDMEYLNTHIKNSLCDMEGKA